MCVGLDLIVSHFVIQFCEKPIGFGWIAQKIVEKSKKLGLRKVWKPKVTLTFFALFDSLSCGYVSCLFLGFELLNHIFIWVVSFCIVALCYWDNFLTWILGRDLFFFKRKIESTPSSSSFCFSHLKTVFNVWYWFVVSLFLDISQFLWAYNFMMMLT